MVDIHSHIIPAYDDGSRNLEESLEIARIESEGGTRVMFATPHVVEMLDVQNSERILGHVEKLNQEFARRQMGILVIPGAELFPSKAIMYGLDKGLPITLAGTKKYVLIDLPHSLLPNDFASTIFEIQARGITPILAHPERCPTFQVEPEKTKEFFDRGVAFQLNVASFHGRHGADAYSCVRKLFRMRIAHFVASDAHRPRPTSLGEMVKMLGCVDHAYIHMLTIESGEAVLQGKALPQIPEPVFEEPKKESWLSKAFGRRSYQVKAI